MHPKPANIKISYFLTAELAVAQTVLASKINNINVCLKLNSI